MIVPGPNARMKRVLGRITVESQADACSVASRKSLPMSDNAVESLTRPTVVVGATSSGKYRLESARRAVKRDRGL